MTKEQESTTSPANNCGKCSIEEKAFICCSPLLVSFFIVVEKCDRYFSFLAIAVSQIQLSLLIGI
ncbi:MAG: hypothetical protein AB4372_22390 [Xenococcus sp. (in: cyanobacteria)]